jgi:hypothetical protein
MGSSRYRKIEEDSSRLIEVSVFLLWVKKEKKRWPEKVQRRRAWFDIQTAAKRVREPQLKSIINSQAVSFTSRLARDFVRGPKRPTA